MDESNLPDPVYSYCFNQYSFDVFEAKRLFEENWLDENLKRLVLKSRLTYRDYYSEDIPLIDEYDNKSAIYITRATYPIGTGNSHVVVQEWSSLRFLPSGGVPLNTLDFKLYTALINGEKREIAEIFSQTLYPTSGDKSDYNSRIISYSRLCAIRPVSELADSIVESWFMQRYGKRKNLTTGVCFLLMNQAFAKFCKNTNRSIDWLSCQMHEKVMTEILTFETIEGVFTFPFQTAAEVLMIKDPDRIFLDRVNNDAYIYSYPGYFLDSAKLLHELTRLVESKIINPVVVEQYVPNFALLQSSTQHFSVKTFRHLGELLVKDELLVGKNMTCKELRLHLNSTVPDGVQLFLTPFQTAELFAQWILSELKEINV